VEHEFWYDFCPRIRQYAADKGKHNFLQFGEAFDGDDNLLGAYTQGEGVDSVFYFSQYYSVFRGAMLGDGSRTCEIERLHCRRLGCAADPCGEGGPIDALYSDHARPAGPVGEDGVGLNPQQLVVNFLSNHDVGRFLFFMPEHWPMSEKRKLLHLALAYLLTAEGIPCLYYGVEQEFAGGNDPANRETMWSQASYKTRVWKDGHWAEANKTYDSDGDGNEDTVWEPFDTGNPTFLYIQHLNQIRAEHVALRRGSLVHRWTTSDSGDTDHGIYAFERVHPDERVLVILNLDGREPAAGEDPYPPSATSRAGTAMTVGFTPGTVLTDLLDDTFTATVTGTGCTAGAGEGCLDTFVLRRTARILVES
jgi:glycosidase